MRDIACVVFGAFLAFSVVVFFGQSKTIDNKPAWQEEQMKRSYPASRTDTPPAKKSCVVAPGSTLYRLENGSLIQKGNTIDAWLKVRVLKRINTDKEVYLLVQGDMPKFEASIMIVKENYVIYLD